MKKIMMAAVALICMTLAGVSFASCGSSDDDAPKSAPYTFYVSESSVTFFIKGDNPNYSPADVLALQLQVTKEYSAAISAAAPEGKSETDVTEQVKKNCDAVFADQKSKWADILQGGKVVIQKSYNGKIEDVATYQWQISLIETCRFSFSNCPNCPCPWARSRDSLRVCGTYPFVHPR